MQPGVFDVISQSDIILYCSCLLKQFLDYLSLSYIETYVHDINVAFSVSSYIDIYTITVAKSNYIINYAGINLAENI